MTDLIVTLRAQELLDALPDNLRPSVEAAIADLPLDPWSHGKPLRGRMEGSWVARIGSYRIIYTIEERPSRSRVIVQAVLHRAVAYRSRRPRR